MPELMMNVRTCVAATTTYTIVCQITMSDSTMNVHTCITVNLLTACCMSYLMMIVHTCATVSTTYSMLYVRSLCRI